MAAIYSGIHLKLKSVKTSWEDKLKLAQFAWVSHQCFLPNKEQAAIVLETNNVGAGGLATFFCDPADLVAVFAKLDHTTVSLAVVYCIPNVLLDWVSHSLVSCYNKKLELPDEIIEKLWIYLDNIVHSKKLQSLFKDGKTITLRFSIAQVINEQLSISYTQRTLKNVSSVLSCCGGILSLPPLSLVYTAKFELLVDLLSKLSWLACWQLSSKDAVSSQLLDILQLTLGQYLRIQRQQANANRVFGQVTKHLLQPCLLLRHLLTTGMRVPAESGSQHQRRSREIRNHIEALLRAAVFQPELLSSYREELLPEKEPANIKKGALKNTLLPASTIQTALGDTNFRQPALHEKAVASSVPLLFKLFLDSYSKAENHLLCFHMLTRLFGCLGISHLQEDLWNSHLSPSQWSSELLAVEQLLNSVLSTGIYNVAADKIRHKEIQFRFYRQLAQVLLNQSQVAIPAWFRCLKSLISLNHLIVEPDLDDLVATVWIDAAVSEPRTKKAQEALVGTLFHTYTKLRQFQRLFEEVLSVICRPAVEELRLPVLPVSIRAKLCECLLDLPPNQILDIVSVILEKCQTFIIPDVKGDSEMALKLHSMSTLLHSVLFHMRSLDDSSPLPVVHRTQRLLETMQREVIQVLFNLLKDCHPGEAKLELWTEKVGDSALLLACTWVATDTLFGLNCKQYASPLAKTAFALADSSINQWDFSAILPGLDAQCWEQITNLLRCSWSASRYCTEWLVLQKMKKMLMHTSSQAELLHQVLQQAVAFILHSGQSRKNGEEPEPWDGSASTVTSLAYPTAHWHLIVTNLPVLFPYLSLGDALYVADVFLKALLAKQTQETSGDDEDDDDDNNNDSNTSLITIGRVSKDLLHSSHFPEMRVLHSSFLSRLIQQCADELCAAVKDAADQPLQQLSAADTPWCEAVAAGHSANIGPSDESLMCWTVLENVAQNILSLVRERENVRLEEEHIKRLLDLLEVISALRLDSLFPLDHTRCFLLLLSLAVNTRASVACSVVLSSKFLARCFHLLACLQTGRNANASFKVLHASDVLEAVLTSMFTVCKTLASDAMAASWDEFVNGIQIFLEHYLRIILERRQSTKRNLEKFMSFLAMCQPQAVNWSPAADQVLLVALTAQCHALTLHLQQQQGKQQVTETLLVLLEQAVTQAGATVQFCLRNSMKGRPLPLAFIPCISTLLTADSSCAHSAGLGTSEHEPRRPMGPSTCHHLSHTQLYQSFFIQILRELDLAKGNIQFLHSALQFLSVFCSMPELYPAHANSVAVFCTIKKLLAAPGVTVQLIQDLEVQLTELTTHLVEHCTTDDFCAMLKLVLEGLDIGNLWKHRLEEALSAVTLVKVLLGCPLNGEKGKAFWFSSPRIIMAFIMQTREASQDPALLSTLIVPILEAAAILIRRGEGALSNPHHVALVFNILLTAPLDQRDYGHIFLGIHEVLFSILQCHPKVMLKAAPSFLNSFHRLVISVMHEGRQRGDKGITDDFEVILKCAQLVERMYSYIAAKTEEFTVLSSFIVAQYVIELQKVTLHPAVKKHLTEGIYHILDLCIERDIKFLNASLPVGVREVLKELYRDYTHYHKDLKQGDEKYTA